jgi:hypothetical protein
MLAIALAILAVIAGFNAMVDPFGMYSRVETNKPTINTRMRLYKAFEVERVKPQTLILGSSRTHVGLRCSHEALAELEAPCYNLAFDGATTKEMYYYLLHAQSIKPLKHVILGLDAYHASPAPAFTRTDFDPLLLYTIDKPHWFRFITADLRLLTSLDTLIASIQALRETSTEPTWFAKDGQRLGEVFFRRSGEDFINISPRAYFDKYDKEGIALAAHILAPQNVTPHPAPKTAVIPADPKQSSLAYINNIIEFCRSNNIDLRIFIAPSHARQQETEQAISGLPAIENGKRDLTQLIADDEKKNPNLPPIMLMDFSGYSSITTEQPSKADTKEEMRYYWDSSHFKEIVGDYVLDRIFEKNDSNHSYPIDFGSRLTPETIENVLAKDRDEQKKYRLHNPEEVSLLNSWIDAVKNKKTKVTSTVSP